MKLTKIYTRTGDAGQTSLVGGIRVSKDSARLEAYGTVDELSSNLGLLAALLERAAEKNSHVEDGASADEPSPVSCDWSQDIYRIQNNLFNVCTYLATDTMQTPVYPSAKLDQAEITFLEEQIDSLNSQLPPLNSFVLPGGCMAAAQCHVCRTVCRRAERRIVTLMNEITTNSSHSVSCDMSHDFNPDMLKYINRLSDYLFVLSRKLNIIYNTTEKTWQNTCK